MHKVSVIIPIYGVERYIERCARSLFEQTLKSMEFIFVDDCTTDNSISILQRVLLEYPERANQTLIMHHSVNLGLPSARYTGLCAASGEYVAHCDSDDWVDRRMYETMYEVASREDADVVVCDYCRTDGVKYNKTIVGCHSTSITTFIGNCLFQIDSWAVWNKLVKKERYQGVITPRYSMGEDLVTTLQVLTKCSKLCYCPHPFYHYFYNPTSMTTVATIDSCERKFNQMKSNVDYLIGSMSTKAFPQRIREGLVYIKYNVLTILLPVIHKKVFYAKWKNAYSNLSRELLLSKYISIKIKIQYLLTILRLYPSRRVRIKD